MSDALENWRSFQTSAQKYFSRLWLTDLLERPVPLPGHVSKKFDLVSPDLRVVGDVKWLKNIKDPAAKWQAIAESVWLLQRVEADRVFMVFGRDVEVPERWLKRMRPLTDPVEFYFLGDVGHRRI